MRSWFSTRLAEVSPETVSKDPKSSLQEYLQGRGLPLPRYELKSVQGEDHCAEFFVACEIDEPLLATEGQGSSRRRAEQAAAAEALQALETGSA